MLKYRCFNDAFFRGPCFPRDWLFQACSEGTGGAGVAARSASRRCVSAAAQVACQAAPGGTSSALISTHWSLLVCMEEPAAPAERMLLLHVRVHLLKRRLWVQSIQLRLPVGEALVGPLWGPTGWTGSGCCAREGCPAPATLVGCQEPGGSNQKETPREGCGPGAPETSRVPCWVQSSLAPSWSHPGVGSRGTST